MTRGDGGQNLIGAELREALGLIRTQELLAARKIDGGTQFFTMANDFDILNPKETLSIWDKDQVLVQTIACIQKFKPDIIINRFNSGSSGRTHGHHTASAMISERAFEQLHADQTTWRPQRRSTIPHGIFMAVEKILKKPTNKACWPSIWAF